VRRALWTGGGFVAVGVGGVGIVVPGLPSLVFFVCAAWCFSHSSARFEQWVLDLPRVGPMVRDHRAGLGMPRRSKAVAIAMMWAAIVVSGIVLRDLWWLPVTLVAAGVIGTAVIAWRVPTREREIARRAASAVSAGVDE
jgi:uncharacterized membrane protein YbaN (DUF454 family)